MPPAVHLSATHTSSSQHIPAGAAAAEAASRKLLTAQRSLQQGRPNWGQGWQQQWNQGQGQGGGNRGQGNSGSSAGSAAGGGNSRPNRNRNKGDVSSLSRFAGGAQGLRGRPRQTIAAPTTGPASTLYQGFRRGGGNAKANAQSLAETYNSNSEAAATAVASAATEGGASSTAVAEAVAATTVAAPNVAPGERQRLPCGLIPEQGLVRCLRVCAYVASTCSEHEPETLAHSLTC